jgi:hypothetical protein
MDFKISESRLRKIIMEELSALNEAVDHESAKKVVTLASKLLKVAEDFKSNATATMTNAVTPHIDSLISMLEKMVSSPATYADKPKVEPRRVKLRAVKDSE